MLLKPQTLPAGFLRGWEAEIVETTALDASVVRRAPTGYDEHYPVAGSLLVCSGSTLQQNKPDAIVGSREGD